MSLNIRNCCGGFVFSSGVHFKFKLVACCLKSRNVEIDSYVKTTVDNKVLKISVSLLKQRSFKNQVIINNKG